MADHGRPGSTDAIAMNHPPEIAQAPANIEAEQAVLGSLLIDPDAMPKASALLKPEDFYRERHGWLYAAMRALSDRNVPVDFVTLVDELERDERLVECGGPAYITELIEHTPTSIYIEHYAAIVEENARRRRLIAGAGKIAEAAYDTSRNIDDVMEAAEQSVFDVSQQSIKRGPQMAGEILPGVLDRIDFLARNPNMLEGLPTGFHDMDKMLGGFHRSDLIILAARPGMGKSSLVTGIAAQAAMKLDARVGIFSLEMSSEQIIQRVLAAETRIDSHRIRMGQVYEEEWPMLLEAANSLQGCPLFIDDTPAIGIGELRSKARRLYAEHGLDLLIVDYMQLMATDRGQSRHLELGAISRGLKALAKELDVPVVALSQLSRAVEQRADKRPMLSDLRESGNIEEDADVVMFIYRDDYYHEGSDRQNIADIIIPKHRHGATGTVSLYFRKELTQFNDMELHRTELDY